LEMSLENTGSMREQPPKVPQPQQFETQSQLQPQSATATNTTADATARAEENPISLREKVQRIFDKFDSDQSGSISTHELERIVAELNLHMTKAQVEKMMKEADPDGSGEIDRAEFEAALRSQASQSSDLGTVFSQAESLFGWLNPGSWFGKQASDPSAGRANRASKKSTVATTTPALRNGLPPSPKPQQPQLEFSKPATPPISPTKRVPFPSPRITQMKASQRAHQEDNLDKGKEMRLSNDAWKHFHNAQKEHFLYHQRRKIRHSHSQEMDAAMAVETLKSLKREDGKDMRSDFEDAWLGELDKKRAHAAKGRERVLEAKAAKEVKVHERMIWKSDKAAEASAIAKIERAKRREWTKATQRAEMKAAKAFTARVRHETRPAVRQEGRNMFQMQRDAIVAGERARQKHDRRQIESTKKQFLSDHSSLREEVQRLDAVAKAARGQLAEVRTHAADDFRFKMSKERERKRQVYAAIDHHKKSAHDAIFDWNTASVFGYPQC